MRTAYIRYDKATREIVIKIASDEIWNEAIEAAIKAIVEEGSYNPASYYSNAVRKLKK